MSFATFSFSYWPGYYYRVQCPQNGFILVNGFSKAVPSCTEDWVEDFCASSHRHEPCFQLCNVAHPNISLQSCSKIKSPSFVNTIQRATPGLYLSLQYSVLVLVSSTRLNKRPPEAYPAMKLGVSIDGRLQVREFGAVQELSGTLNVPRSQEQTTDISSQGSFNWIFLPIFDLCVDWLSHHTHAKEALNSQWNETFLDCGALRM